MSDFLFLSSWKPSKALPSPSSCYNIATSWHSPQSSALLGDTYTDNLCFIQNPFQNIHHVSGAWHSPHKVVEHMPALAPSSAQCTYHVPEHLRCGNGLDFAHQLGDLLTFDIYSSYVINKRNSIYTYSSCLPFRYWQAAISNIYQSTLKSFINTVQCKTISDTQRSHRGPGSRHLVYMHRKENKTNSNYFFEITYIWHSS